MQVPRKHVGRILLVTAFVLSLPLLAMQVTDEVDWGPGDFAVAGILLIGTGLMYVRASSHTNRTAYRVAVGLTLATALLLVWMNLAVGLIGDEGNPANLMYIGVLAVGFAGAAAARLEARGMARALLTTALAQALVSGIATMVWRPSTPSGVVHVLGVNAVFVVLWLASALLFQRAGARLGVEPTA